MTTSTIAILLMSTLGCLGASAWLFVLIRSNRRKDQLLTDLQNTLGHATLSQQESAAEASPFDDNLRTAALTTRLQQPRLAIQQTCHATTPERYSYIQSLVAKGMDTQEIAALLSMSIQETTQVITLMHMAQPQLKEVRNIQPAHETLQASPGTKTTPGQLQCNSMEQTAPTALQTNGDSALNHSGKSRTKSMKLARWIKNKTLSASLSRQKSGRQPPPAFLHPHGERGRPLSPLPGYS